MKTTVAIITGFVFLLAAEKIHAQVQTNAPVSFDKVVPVSPASQADTLNVIVNQPKRIDDYYSTPVPANPKNDSTPAVTNPAKRENDPH